MSKTSRTVLYLLLMASLLMFSGCGDSDSSTEEDTNTSTETNTTITDTDFETTDWTEATHSKGADPDFDEVFDDTQVKRFDFVVTSERWQSMLDDMTETYGTFGGDAASGPGAGGPGAVGGPGDTAGGPGGAAEGTLDGVAPAAEETVLVDSDEDPIFVPADIYYDGIQWYRVGIRFKGNSSLQTSWENGILKLSFKLDFDEFEDDYPQIDNQRFYGFKKFSLKNNFDDSSFLREKVAADVFKDAGLAVSHTAFYALYIDHGEGPEYFGLYTLVEEVDGTVLDTQFSEDDGNLYKPEDGSADFVENTFDADDFTKKTNEDDEDWSDIESLFAALHDGNRTTDALTWREELETVFDVDQYLKYLAVNGIIQNWDSYGLMTHNYYLYNNPDNGKLTWIPWDHNEALEEGKRTGALALDFSDLDDASWPLIAKIYEDTEYKVQYDLYLQEVIDGAFSTATMQDKYDTYSNLIEEYATSERSGYSFLNSSSDFTDAITELKAHASDRATAVADYLE